MASIRCLVKDYIASHGNPSVIKDVDALYFDVIRSADKPDIGKAIAFYQRNVFRNTLLSLGYYNGGENDAVNVDCDDADKLTYVAYKAKKSIMEAAKRYKRFGYRVNEISGQMVFDVGEDGELVIREAK